VIYNFFPVPVQITELKLNTKEILEYCKSMKDKKSSVEISNIGGWQSPKLEGEHPILNPLFNAILDLSEEYRKIIKYKFPLKIDNLWININKQKDYNVEHHHPNCVLSGVFYVDITEGELMFTHPAWSTMEYDWSFPCFENSTLHNSTRWKVLPKPNTLIIFPSWLMHSVLPHSSEKERITISFNLAK
jgi:uncharacterized protein (TIGR02466 family)